MRAEGGTYVFFLRAEGGTYVFVDGGIWLCGYRSFVLWTLNRTVPFILMVITEQYLIYHQAP